jgi:hypothetical protein
MTDSSRPAQGDIVVCQQQRDELLVYILRSATGPDQILVHSRQTALEQAASIARRQRVRAWLTTDGRDHLPLEYVTPPRSTPHAATPAPPRRGSRDDRAGGSNATPAAFQNPG